MLSGFPSPLGRGTLGGWGLKRWPLPGKCRPVTLNLPTAGHLWGAEKTSQWYAVYALAGPNDTIFSLKAMPVIRVASQDSQVVTLRNDANGANIGYGFTANELAGAGLLILSGASRGLVRAITANNADNGTGGTITYGGAALTLAQGDWGMVLPATNFRRLGMVLNDASGNLAPFYQEAGCTNYASPRQLCSGAINGYTLMDLGLVAPPTAYMLTGYAAAAAGYDVKLAVSYDGSTPALVVHGPARRPPPSRASGGPSPLPARC